mmetsp:Transcript_9950/g.29497  ORF Transcript_9950/g.29497 Transcript_9950/m.29497 type:complete len:207 (+) Transcript_9950:625-1245(+)
MNREGSPSPMGGRIFVPGVGPRHTAPARRQRDGRSRDACPPHGADVPRPPGEGASGRRASGRAGGHRRVKPRQSISTLELACRRVMASASHPEQSRRSAQIKVTDRHGLEIERRPPLLAWTPMGHPPGSLSVPQHAGIDRLVGIAPGFSVGRRRLGSIADPSRPDGTVRGYRLGQAQATGAPPRSADASDDDGGGGGVRRVRGGGG